MPTYMKDGERHFVSLITGPSHVLLGVEFSTVPVETPRVVRKPAVGEGVHSKIDETALVSAVQSGIAEVSDNLHVAEIVYVDNDSPHYSLFSQCAKLLAERQIEDRA
jgi:hypothetical protein